VIVLVEKGECTNVSKARNVEHAGAIMMIVIDKVQEDINQVILSDDGTGQGIRIPSLLISKLDGAKIKNAVEKGQVSLLS